jgi:hypothetical protein
MAKQRTEQSEPNQAARRMSLSQVVEALLQRGGSEHSSVTLSRNAKGETQIEVVVRTGDQGAIQTIEQAETAADEVYSRLRSSYPFGATPTDAGASS